jgi:membrane protease YdiL (CAAX protease family)
VRALWRITAFALLAGGTMVLFGGVLYTLLAGTPVVGWSRLARFPLDMWIQLACVVASTRVTAHFFGIRDVWQLIGLDRTAMRAKPVAIGAVTGLAIVIVPALVFLVTGIAHFEASASADSALFVTWGALALLIPAALSEELLFRGYLLSTLRESAGDWSAILITSALFGLAHALNPGASVFSVLAVAIAGVFLALVRLGTGSLWAAFGAHLAVNAAQLVILHAPVSGLPFDTPVYRFIVTGPAWLTGGSWGPEGGAAVVAAMLLATFLLRKSALKRTEHG